ncbi:hypothetical protein TRFO_32677 [Tritrichomonas foetus]|uniref:HMG box domain-containing protein n=1 Tax=Tritrichomonas foetus TaxID=1144522 RepID=A0A1J4JPE7_9EUKA|nr:hypothetical protein TRFO_32677 [Tritrichomonas foetus]|eukprot:OHT00618.1 hypothetical protein TRFO_32677 [Tritrichomonas foetus]
MMNSRLPYNNPSPRVENTHQTVLNTHGKKMEPYQIFFLMNRKNLQESHRDLNAGEVTSILGQIWRSLSPKKRQKYIEISNDYNSNSLLKEKSKDPFSIHKESRSTNASVASTITNNSSSENSPPKINKSPQNYRFTIDNNTFFNPRQQQDFSNNTNGFNSSAADLTDLKIFQINPDDQKYKCDDPSLNVGKMKNNQKNDSFNFGNNSSDNQSNAQQNANATPLPSSNLQANSQNQHFSENREKLMKSSPMELPFIHIVSRNGFGRDLSETSLKQLNVSISSLIANHY